MTSPIISGRTEDAKSSDTCKDCIFSPSFRNHSEAGTLAEASFSSSTFQLVSLLLTNILSCNSFLIFFSPSGGCFPNNRSAIMENKRYMNVMLGIALSFSSGGGRE